jgi:hypothetical protein
MRRVVIVSVFMAALAVGAHAADDAVSGRWVFDFDLAGYEKDTPMAARPRYAGVEIRQPDTRPVPVVIEVTALPGGALIGWMNGAQGARWSGAGAPQGPVEIADGRVTAQAVSFTVWRFDGLHNQMQVDGTVQGDVMTLTLRRTGQPSYATEVKARRVSHRTTTRPGE